MRESIHRFKYRRERARGDYLGSLLAESLRRGLGTEGVTTDLVVPLPLHPRRERERGFNQAAVLATPVARVLGAPVLAALERTTETRSQVGLGFEARRRNVRQAFRCVAHDLNGLHVLLIDDVVTTGATFEAAARALLGAGAARVDGLALAREI